MKPILLFSLGSLLFVSCSKDRLTANGEQISETREPGSFKGVTVTGSTDAIVTYGDEFKVVLSGSSNLIPRFKTTVRSGILYLEYEHVNVAHDDIQVTVVVPELERLAVSGSAGIDVNTEFPEVDKLTVLISGSGSIKIRERLTVEEISVDISGSGNADLLKLQAINADVNISGSGDVKVGPLDNLKARISGSGNIYYMGNPQTDVKISGSGKAIKR